MRRLLVIACLLSACACPVVRTWTSGIESANTVEMYFDAGIPQGQRLEDPSICRILCPRFDGAATRCEYFPTCRHQDGFSHLCEGGFADHPLEFAFVNCEAPAPYCP